MDIKLYFQTDLYIAQTAGIKCGINCEKCGPYPIKLIRARERLPTDAPTFRRLSLDLVPRPVIQWPIMAYRDVNCLDPTGVNHPKMVTLSNAPDTSEGPSLKGQAACLLGDLLSMSFQSYINEILLFETRTII
jgi:hypothetical protein